MLDRCEMHRAALAAHQTVVAGHQFPEHLLDRYATCHRVRVTAIGAEAEIAGLHGLGKTGGHCLLPEGQVARSFHKILKKQIMGPLFGLPEGVLAPVQSKASRFADVVVQTRPTHTRRNPAGLFFHHQSYLATLHSSGRGT